MSRESFVYELRSRIGLVDVIEQQQEKWKAVAGYEGLYEISDAGMVKSLDRTVACTILGKTSFKKCKGRCLVPGLAGNGYLTVNLWKDGKVKTAYVHHLVLNAFVGPCPKDEERCHNNGIKTDNRLINLRYDTASANQADKLLHGTDNNGERCGTHKLTELEVRQIKVLLKEGTLVQASIGKMFGVKREVISKIKNNKRWRCVA